MQSGESLRDELLAEVETMAPILTQHAPQSEKLGRLDEPTVETLRKTRLLRFVCPREHEADPITEMEVLEAVTRIDGSAGWTLGILAITSAFAGAFLPVETAQRIFAKGVPPMAGMIQAKGKAEPVTGGYRVTGRWAFGSGIYHADWVIAGAFLPDQPLPAGIRMVLLPRRQVVIHDNWQVAGLKASGSCDYSIENVSGLHSASAFRSAMWMTHCSRTSLPRGPLGSGRNGWRNNPANGSASPCVATA